MGFDSRWVLVDLARLRAAEDRPTRGGDLWRRALEGAAWATIVALPDRHDLGLLLALRDVAAQVPLYSTLPRQQAEERSKGPFANATLAEHNALCHTLTPFTSRYLGTKARSTALKTLGVDTDGAPALALGPKKVTALARWAPIFEEHLAANPSTWDAATAYVERDVFARFLRVIAELPKNHVLLTSTI